MTETKLKFNQAVGSYISPPQGYLINGKISVTVSSNNITVALKTLAGNNPSPSDPIYVRIGDTVRAVTATLSTTINAGSNWCGAGSAETAGKEIDYFVYIGWDSAASVLGFGFSRIPYAQSWADFSLTATNDTAYLQSGWVNTLSTDNVENIGRFSAILSASSNYYWSVPTFTPTNLIQRPIYETRTLTWKPTYTGFSSPTTDTLTYQIKNATLFLNLIGGFGTSNSATFNLTLPITPAGAINGASYNTALIGVVDNTAYPTTPGVAGWTSSRTLYLGKLWSSQSGYAFGGFTTSGTKGVLGVLAVSLV